MNAIEISNLFKTFKGKRFTKVDALKDLSLTVAAGEIFGFLGPNGAGKSTTIKILMGLISASRGDVRLLNQPSSNPSSRQKVGYLPENPAFYDYLSAEEYVHFVARSFDVDEQTIKVRSEEVLRLLELWDARKRPIRTYSKGMVQRVGLAQVLVHDPDIYILDEPMSGLDPLGRSLVKQIILELKAKGKTVFFSTHITSDVETVCDRVAIILNGTLQRVERVETILTEGISGYTVRLKAQEGAGHQQFHVAKDELSAFMAKAQVSGHEIVLIEPNRKSLEEFFLDLVRSEPC